MADPATPPSTWRLLLARASQRLGDHDARRVLERASGYDGGELWLHLDEAAPARAADHVDAMVARRLDGEPLQYVLGRWGFRRLDLVVDRRVLIPRPETEEVAGMAISLLRQAPSGRRRLLDLGTGSGAIALAVADEVGDARVWAVDVSPGALAVARANLAGMGRRVGGRVRLVEGSWYSPLDRALAGTLQVIVANPPYVASGERLAPEVADWEPGEALFSGPTGLEAVAAVVAGAPDWLAPGGSLVVEIAPDLAPEALAVARAGGLGEAEVRPDLTGRARMLVARNPPY